mmetsp:Transcript_4795/g.6696  ORF Transcript_4795/g.6696 Transcript_4795/m.6696 type:complete len:247 (-) Transcript_4795:511-1251(-)|eukprot:CAMPEP_0194047900 /NCGR_PEP_ID=MMETSP0009_2-20130614/26050_1 /TAXON_ID=210454 /ORGANISM="Grammatophora oceanica, Strain CCMP 410" /LENGTH=246 /DNA_ID=CAMNT_0038693643 /DNA_START=122 /DNA_END=862 /DNA_ORIENTATION=+
MVVPVFQIGMVAWLLAGAVPLMLFNRQQQQDSRIGGNNNSNDPSFRAPWGKTTDATIKLPEKILHNAAWLLPSVLSMNFHSVKTTTLSMLGLRVFLLELARRGKPVTRVGAISMPALAALVVPTTLPPLIGSKTTNADDDSSKSMKSRSVVLPDLKKTSLASAATASASPTQKKKIEAASSDDGNWWITKKLVGDRQRPHPDDGTKPWHLTSQLVSSDKTPLVAGSKRSKTLVTGKASSSIKTRKN